MRALWLAMFVKTSLSSRDSRHTWIFVEKMLGIPATRYYILDFQVVMIGQGMRPMTGIFGMIPSQKCVKWGRGR